MPARKQLRAIDAANDGVRRLRELLRFRAPALVATKLGCDATAVRRWARGSRSPSAEWRERMQEVLGIPAEAWELALEDDAAITRPRA